MFLSWIDVKTCSKVMSTTQTVKLKRRAADLHTDCFHFSFFLRRSYRVRQTAGGCRQLKTFFSLYLTDRACGFDEAPFCYFKVKIMGKNYLLVRACQTHPSVESPSLAQTDLTSFYWPRTIRLCYVEPFKCFLI